MLAELVPPATVEEEVRVLAERVRGPQDSGVWGLDDEILIKGVNAGRVAPLPWERILECWQNG